MPTKVTATLAHYAAMTMASVADFLAKGEPAAYLYDLVRDYPSRESKGLRPALLLATCQAYGGRPRTGLSTAVALELLHNAFLIHDDIEDDAAVRRGRKTLHTLHGVPLAINAGDSLAHLAFAPILADRELHGPLGRRVLTELSRVVRHTTEGQALELGWRAHNVIDLTQQDYLELVGKKTCWYTTIGPIRLGALLAPDPPRDLTALSRLGFLLGIAFQIRDDLLNLDPSADTGKEALTDIGEGKRTLMLIHLMRHASEKDRRWIAEYLAPGADRSLGARLNVLDLMHRLGSLGFAEEFAAGIEAAAHESLAAAFAGMKPNDHLDFIAGLVPYMLSRRH